MSPASSKHGPPAFGPGGFQPARAGQIVRIVDAGFRQFLRCHPGLRLQPDIALAKVRLAIPLRRLRLMKEVGAVVAFLASEGGAYITGQNIRVDGGLARPI
ncbi:MAG: SDR family oxidoreductase [Chloroflexi bacterium]|nr:SDR family oxidoreductase [Chloroflexota bacterium]